MDVKAKGIIDVLETIAPLNLQEDWDNSGLQVGDINQVVKGILLVVDLTDKAVDYAIEKGLNLIISHHPFIFSGIKQIDFGSYKGRLIKKLIDNEILVYSSHTSLDKADFGVNQVLGNLFNLQNMKTLLYMEETEEVFGVIGDFNGSVKDLVSKISNISPIEDVNFYGKAKDHISRVMIIGGGGAFALNTCKDLGGDCLITGDAKHHDGQDAYEKDLLLVDLNHFYSELPVLTMLKNKLEKIFRCMEIEIYSDPVFLLNNKIKESI